MKDSTGTVRMCGKRMEVLLEVGCVTNCTSDIAGKLPGIMRQLCKSLEMRDVAWFFINDVRIGEAIALVDNVKQKARCSCKITGRGISKFPALFLSL